MTRCSDASQRTASHVPTRTAWTAIALAGFVFVVVGPPAARAGSNVWTSNGPGGVRIGALAIDPTTPSTTLAARTYDMPYTGRSAGIFTSTDGAASWHPATSGLPGGTFVNTLAIDRSAQWSLYVGTQDQGVFKSSDRASSWQSAGSGLPGSAAVRALAIDPTRPSTLYAGAQYHGVFKSTDSAASWQLAATRLAFDVSAIAIDPTSPSTLYALSAPPFGYASVVKSTDGAATWQRASTGLPGDTPVLALAIDPATPSTQYAGAGGGVFKSTDGAASWQPTTHGLPGDTFVLALAIDPTTPSTLYAGTGGGVFKSTDGAGSWQRTAAGLPEDTSVPALAIDPTTPSTLYAATSTYDGEHGTFSTGVFKSIDGAGSWQSISAGLPFNVDVTTLAVDPTTPSTLYAGTRGLGVFSMQQAAVCVGDCGGDHTVTVDELLTLVNIALETQPASACPNGLAPGTAVDVALIIQAVNNALSACSGA